MFSLCKEYRQFVGIPYSFMFILFFKEASNIFKLFINSALLFSFRALAQNLL